MQLIDYKVSQKLTAFYPMNLIYLESRSSRSIICFKFYIESITCTGIPYVLNRFHQLSDQYQL